MMMLLGYIFMCLVFGTTYFAIKVGLNDGIPPIFFASVRFLIAGIIILAYYLLRRNVTFPKTFKVYVEIVFVGILMTTIPFAALFWSQQHITSGEASLLVASAPIFIGLLSKMDRTQWLGFGIAIVGIYCIVFPGLVSIELTVENIIAKFAIIISEFFFAYGLIRSKKLLTTSQISPQLFNGLEVLFAAIILLGASFIWEDPLLTTWSMTSVYSVFYLAVIASVFASGIYYWLVKVTDPLFPSTWTYVSPIIAMVMGFIFLNEKITMISGVGAALIIGGILIVNKQSIQKLFNREISFT